MKKKNKYKPLTEARLVEILEVLTILKDNDRVLKVLTGCSTYDSIDAMEFCGSNKCSNCTKRQIDFHEAMKLHVKNLFKDEEE
ncbi:MAG: hypothetical protein HRT87_07065 [Legionellales bacterium]|nr:hypothetical protein [Legionellales bacterium]